MRFTFLLVLYHRNHPHVTMLTTWAWSYEATPGPPRLTFDFLTNNIRYFKTRWPSDYTCRHSVQNPYRCILLHSNIHTYMILLRRECGTILYIHPSYYHLTVPYHLWLLKPPSSKNDWSPHNNAYFLTFIFFLIYFLIFLLQTPVECLKWRMLSHGNISPYSLIFSNTTHYIIYTYVWD